MDLDKLSAESNLVHYRSVKFKSGLSSLDRFNYLSRVLTSLGQIHLIFRQFESYAVRVRRYGLNKIKIRFNRIESVVQIYTP